MRYFCDFSVPLALLQPRLMKVRQKSHELRIKALNQSLMIVEAERYWNVPFVLSLRVYPDDTPISRELLQSSTLMVFQLVFCPPGLLIDVGHTNHDGGGPR